MNFDSLIQLIKGLDHEQLEAFFKKFDDRQLKKLSDLLDYLSWVCLDIIKGRD